MRPGTAGRRMCILHRWSSIHTGLVTGGPRTGIILMATATVVGRRTVRTTMATVRIIHRGITAHLTVVTIVDICNEGLAPPVRRAGPPVLGGADVEPQSGLATPSRRGCPDGALLDGV